MNRELKVVLVGLIICEIITLGMLYETLGVLQDVVQERLNPLIEENNKLRQACNEAGINPLDEYAKPIWPQLPPIEDLTK